MAFHLVGGQTIEPLLDGTERACLQARMICGGARGAYNSGVARELKDNEKLDSETL